MIHSDLTTKFLLGIDIGGTKIDAQLYRVEKTTLSETPIAVFREEARKGLQAHVTQIATLIKTAATQAAGQGGLLVAIGIASPGRFDATGRIKPGSNPNLGNTLHEMDGVNLKDVYRQALGFENTSPLIVCNDADAMLAGMLGAIETNPIPLTDQHGNPITSTSLRGKYVALFGIGTGIGHAIAHIHQGGSFTFKTDGHASKLRIPLDEACANLLRSVKAHLEKSTGREEIVLFPDHTARAEDLFRGPVVSALTQLAGEATALRFAGKYMARTIAVIHSGTSQDVEPAHGWTEAEKQEAARTSVYLIGGGLGSSPLGAEIIRHADHELNALKLPMPLVQFPGQNIAAHAAATLAATLIFSENNSH